MKLRNICAALALSAALCGSLSGCGSEVQRETTQRDDLSMFVMVESSYDWDVVYHRESKVMYAVSNGSYVRGTFTLLVNPDGSPMLWEG